MLDIVTSMTSDDAGKSVPVNAAAANARACQAEEGRWGKFGRKRRKRQASAPANPTTSSTTINSNLVWSQPCNDSFAGRFEGKLSNTGLCGFSPGQEATTQSRTCLAKLPVRRVERPARTSPALTVLVGGGGPKTASMDVSLPGFLNLFASRCRLYSSVNRLADLGTSKVRSKCETIFTDQCHWPCTFNLPPSMLEDVLGSGW